MNLEKSRSLFQRAKDFIPGGVNSPVRAFSAVGGDPVFIRSAKGAYLYDEDGNRYIDLMNSWGPMILGHAWEGSTRAIRERLEHSVSYGAPTALEVEMAKLVCEMVPRLERIRMVNSGTEACMSAIRLARGYTGRDKIIKFTGCYHGHADSFLIKAGSGAMTLGLPNSPGVTKGTAGDTLLAHFNDPQSVSELIENHRGEIAAIILEPVPGNMGCIPPEDSFLPFLREVCNQEDILLIFDEVMSGFRLARGGAQELLGVEADLVTYGKVIGGGMPVGAFGGRAEIMDHVAPTGPVYQAGTLSGNPVAMAAGLAVLRHLNENPEVYSQLQETTARLEEEIKAVLEKHPIDYRINRMGSMMSLHFSKDPVTDQQSAAAADTGLFNKLFHRMLERGVYLPPSAFETWFISTAVTGEHVRHIAQSLDESLDILLKT